MKKQIIILVTVALISGNTVQSGDSYTKLIAKVGTPIDSTSMQVAQDTLEALQISTNPDDLKGEEERSLEQALKASEQEELKRLEEEHILNKTLTRSIFDQEQIKQNATASLKQEIEEVLRKEYELIETVKKQSNPDTYAKLQLEISAISADLINQQDPTEESINTLEQRFISIQSELRKLNPELSVIAITTTNTHNNEHKPWFSNFYNVIPSELTKFFSGGKNTKTETVDLTLITSTRTSPVSNGLQALLPKTEEDFVIVSHPTSRNNEIDEELKKILQASIETHEEEIKNGEEQRKQLEAALAISLFLTENNTSKTQKKSLDFSYLERVNEVKKARKGIKEQRQILKERNPEFTQWLETDLNSRLPLMYLDLDPQLKNALNRKDTSIKIAISNDHELNAAIRLSLLETGSKSTILEPEKQKTKPRKEIIEEVIEFDNFVRSLRVASPDWSKEFRSATRTLVQEEAITAVQQTRDSAPF